MWTVETSRWSNMTLHMQNFDDLEYEVLYWVWSVGIHVIYTPATCVVGALVRYMFDAVIIPWSFPHGCVRLVVLPWTKLGMMYFHVILGNLFLVGPRNLQNQRVDSMMKKNKHVKVEHIHNMYVSFYWRINKCILYIYIFNMLIDGDSSLEILRSFPLLAWISRPKLRSSESCRVSAGLYGFCTSSRGIIWANYLWPQLRLSQIGGLVTDFPPKRARKFRFRNNVICPESFCQPFRHATAGSGWFWPKSHTYFLVVSEETLFFGNTLFAQGRTSRKLWFTTAAIAKSVGREFFEYQRLADALGSCCIWKALGVGDGGSKMFCREGRFGVSRNFA